MKTDSTKMNKTPFELYNAIRGLNDPGARIIHVIRGDHAGELALISGGRIVLCSKAGREEAQCGFIESRLSEVCEMENNRIVDIDGELVYSEMTGGDNKLVICGAGYVSLAMLSTGKLLGFHVTVIDDRLEFVNRAIERGADRVLFNNFEDALQEISGDSDTYFVIATRGHRFDKVCLRSVLDKPNAYIGLMGSKRRVLMLRQELEGEGIDGEMLDPVHMPIGLSIGAETPDEIAISVMAEIIQIKNNIKSGGFDREVLGAIVEEGRERAVLATIVARQGSAPRGIGTKMLICRERIIGTIGGGCLEGSVIAKARRLLMTGGAGPVILDVDISTETAEDEAMVCGGRIKVLLEAV